MFNWFRKSPKPPQRPRAKDSDRMSSPAQMWYRFLTYHQGTEVVSVSVDVMADGPDYVLLPTAESWQRSAPSFARGRRDEVVTLWKSVAWNRELIWEESDHDKCGTVDPLLSPIPGSIESTEGGRHLEKEQLFGPNAPFPFAQARTVWATVEERFALAATGRVTLFVSGARPKSMFNLVSLPALKRNPNVTLDFR